MTTHSRSNRIYRSLSRGVLTAVAVLAVGLPVAALPSGAASAVSPHDSQVTLSGSGIFSGFKVTIGQTQDLVNQVVPITWTSPLGPDGDPIVQNVQIMECWGDDPNGPQPENCEYGAGTQQVGAWGSSRIVAGLEPQLKDTLETHSSFVGFHPVSGEGGPINQYFDSYTTNEVNLAQTYADGTGQVLFNMLTAREAPGLGCGALITDQSGATKEHGCWLVIVPRADHELTSSDVSKGGFVTKDLTGVNSSPLSATNFFSAGIAVPLGFQSLKPTCNINADQVPTFGTELMTGAMSSWEAGMCKLGSAVYGFSQVSDDLARNQVASGVTGLGYMGNPIPASELAAGQKPLYAPVGISGVGIGFYIQRIPSLLSPPDVKAQAALPITDIKLTPRLVAKLLTQSYRLGGSVWDDKLDHSAYDLTRDAEFLALNPEFKNLTYSPGIGDVLMPYIPSDSAKLLWSWINSDPTARGFLDGKPDTDSPAFGGPTYVNPVYKGISLPLSNYPKEDPFCYQDKGYPPLCTLDAHPYANTMQDIASNVSRGNTLQRTTFNGITWAANPPQTPGRINVMGITDTASASRYGLVMARLENANGEFVAPTADSMLAAVAAMKTDPTTGVLVPNPATKAAGAYPLTNVTFAAVLPSALNDKTRADYSSLLGYIATSGQQQGVKPGQLPPGYVPLPANLALQTSKVAEQVAQAPTASPTPTPTQSPSSEPSTAPSTYPTTPAGGGTYPTTPTTEPSGQPTTAPTSSPTAPALVATVTPSLGSGAGAYVIAGALILGAAAALGGPVVSWLASRGRV